MGASEDELSGYIDREETISEGNGNIQGTEPSDVSGLNDQEHEGEPSSPLPEETNLTSETPIGVEEDRILVSQEQAAVKPKTRGKVKVKPKTDDTFRKLSDQLIRHFQASKVAGAKTHDMLQQIQKQLRQIDKIAASGTKQQVVVKQMAIQVRSIQKQLDKVNQSINQFKGIPHTKRKNGK